VVSLLMPVRLHRCLYWRLHWRLDCEPFGVVAYSQLQWQAVGSFALNSIGRSFIRESDYLRNENLRSSLWERARR